MKTNTIEKPKQLVSQETAPQVPNIQNDDSASLMAVISRAATDPSVNIDKLERLMAMYERITEKQGEFSFNQAMAEAQKEMRRIATDSNNPQTRSKYASYAALDRTIRPIYTKHGFGLSFNTAEGAPADHIRIVCDVSNGAFSRRYHIDMPNDGKGAKGGDVMTKTHATGSAVTYGRRYLLAMIFNLAVGSDDDGNAAGPKLSVEDIDNLKEMLKAKDAPEDKFLRWAGVATFEEIAANRYDLCVKAIHDYKKAAQ